MKKTALALALVLVLMMGLMISPVAHANDFANDAYAVVVDKLARSKNDVGDPHLAVTLENVGPEPVDAVGVSVVMLDKDDHLILNFDATGLGFTYEPKGGTPLQPRDLSKPLAPRLKTTFYINTDMVNPLAVKVRAAVTYYRRTNGEEFFIKPESQLWQTTDGKRLEPKVAGGYLPGLSKEDKEKSDSMVLGLMHTPDVMSDEMAQAYNIKQGGVWLIMAVDGYPATKLGIKLDDILVAIDGVRVVDDPRVLDLSRAKLVDGKEVTFTWLRNNEEMSKTISK